MFILIVPTDVLMVSAVLLQPKKWISAFLWVGAGCGIGALALAALIRWGGEPLLEAHFPDFMTSDVMAQTQVFLDSHGLWALGLVALSPLPLQPAVILSTIAGMPLGRLFLSVWIARTLKYFVYAWVAAHTPKLLRKLPGLKSVVPNPEIVAGELPHSPSQNPSPTSP